MTPRLVFRPQAEAELLEAREWYEKQRVGLGGAFAAAVDSTVAGILDKPLAYPRVHSVTDMDPVFSLPYPEFCVAQRLQSLFPSSAGYATFVPVSRQQPGVDLVLVRRRHRMTTAATIQVKSSRTYSPLTNSFRTATKFRYNTWFNTFSCSEHADFFCLLALYPALDARQHRELGTWWAPLILLFSQLEMRRFLGRVRTVGGKRDQMFGFGFDDPQTVYQTRGDRLRRFRDFPNYILERRVTCLRRSLESRPDA